MSTLSQPVASRAAPRPPGRLARLQPVVASLLFLLAAAASGQEEQGPTPTATSETTTGGDETGPSTLAGELGRGKLVRIRLPLTGNADSHFKSVIQRAASALTGEQAAGDLRRPVIVLEFAPASRGTGTGEGSDFERALSLARFLTSRELRGTKTVAYLPESIRGHAALVVLACEEIIMHPQAEIGDVGVDENESQAIDRAVISGYQQICQARRTVPVAIALGMLDRRREVLKVETEQGTEFVLREDFDELEQERTIVSSDTIVPRGSLGRFSGQEGREYGFVKYVAEDREAAAWALRLPADALVEDQSLVGDWRPVMLTIQGPITARVAHRIEKLIGNELLRRDVNWIGVRIDSGGGELDSGIRLANMLAGLDSTQVRTVAYVPVEATGTAALAALACDQLVMHPRGRLRGDELAANEEETLETAAASIRDSLAPEAEREWSLLLATIDHQEPLFAYRNKQSGLVRYFSPAEVAAKEDSQQWLKEKPIKEAAAALDLDGQRAAELGIAWQDVENFDEFIQLYGFQQPPPEVRSSKVLELVEALASPGFAFMLLAIGMIGVYIELHTPGLGVGGFVAAVAFLLFFWSKGLDGTADWLDLLLFGAGIFFVLMEIFVLPGFGIFGLGGGALIVAAIVLASQNSVIPRSESDLAELQTSLVVLVGAMLAVIVVALGMRRFLPHTPFFNYLLLTPPAGEEIEELDDRESVVDFSHLVGATGTATTDLMPAGKATIGHEMIDVIASGEPIERGTAIEVVEVRGNRVLVRQATV